VSQVVYSALKLIRSTCADLKTTVDPAKAEVLGRMDIVLARLLAEESSVRELKSELSGEVQALLGATSSTDDFEKVMADLERVAASLEANSRALQSDQLKKAIGLEQRYWQQFGARVKTEIAAGQGAETEDKGVFNIEGVQAFLRETLSRPDLAIEHYSVASLGFSKKTVLLTLINHGDLPAELALRIDQPYNFLGTTVLDEYQALVHLWQQGVCVPQPLALEDSGRILGQPFIVFERALGAPVGSNFTSPPQNEALVRDFARNLAVLHQVPVELSGIPEGKRDLEKNLDKEIEDSYRDWKGLGMNSAIVEAGFKWVRANRHLGSGPSTVVHNDYNFNNILVRDNKVSAILDWEFVHIGNPAADLGYFYYSAENTASFEVFLDAYGSAGGVVPDQAVLDFYILFGQLRLLIMVFQSEAGFVQGKFTDIRYGITGALFLPISVERVSTKLVELLD
jgi:aminoglycoside phosphotransferase (APT) family kinase protein